MRAVYYLLFCLFLLGCVSEQWVRGYVQYELAGVRDIVTEEVYPLEKAVTDLKTQMAHLIVELKSVSDGLQSLKESTQAGGEKWQGIGLKVAELENDIKTLEKRIEGLTEDLQRLHSVLEKVQTDIETINKGQASETSGEETAPEAPSKETETHEEGEQPGIESETISLRQQ